MLQYILKSKKSLWIYFIIFFFITVFKINVSAQQLINHYTEVDAATSPLGTTGWVQRFENGSIYFNTKQNKGWAVYGDISKVYEASGGSGGKFGFPLGNQYYRNDGQVCQTFEGNIAGKTIELCPNIKLDPIQESINQKANQIGKLTPVGGILNLCGTKIQKFKRSDSIDETIIMYNPEDQKAYYLTGSIYWKFKLLNGNGSENCNGSNYPNTTGYPRNDESTAATSDYATTGKYQLFYHKTTGWNTVYHSWKGTYWVVGNIRNRHEQSNGTDGYIGFPLNDYVNKKSVCNLNGILQEFEGANIYTSSLGTFALSTYNNIWFNEYNKFGQIDNTSSYGWPKSENTVWDSWNTQRMTFERGNMISILQLNGWQFIDSIKSCGSDYQRKDDHISGATQNILQIIWNKENSLFNSFQRNSNELGRVQPFCGGYKVDYTNAMLKDGSQTGYSFIFYNPANSSAHFMQYNIWNYFWNNGQCNIFGLPTSDFTVSRQNFDKGIIFNYWDGIIVKNEKYFHVINPILNKYKLESNKYGLPLNNQEPKYGDYCQTFKGGELCSTENELKMRFIQRQNELGGVSESNYQIITLCNTSAIKYSNLASKGEGIIILNPFNNEIYSITGEIYKSYNCNYHGFPKNESYTFKSAQIQQFTISTLILYDNKTFNIYGNHLNKFESEGVSKLGLPIKIWENEIGYCGVKGSHIDYENGTVFNSQKGLAVMYKYSGIKEEYDNQGGINSEYGWPTSDIQSWNVLGKVQDFDRGKMYIDILGNIYNEKYIGCEGTDTKPEPTSVPSVTPTPSVNVTPIQDNSNSPLNVEEETYLAERMKKCSTFMYPVDVGIQNGEMYMNSLIGTQTKSNLTNDPLIEEENIKIEKENEKLKALLLRKSKNSPYSLPYPAGKAYSVSQNLCNWSNANTNHYPGKSEEFSIDFSMPETNLVSAVADGIIEEFVNPNTPGGAANYMIINHGGGIRSIYYHLYQNSINEFKFKIGDKIIKGQVFARSGNTGWSDGPHLHLHFTINNKSTPIIFNDISVSNNTYYGVPREYNPKFNTFNSKEKFISSN